MFSALFITFVHIHERLPAYVARMMNILRCPEMISVIRFEAGACVLTLLDCLALITLRAKRNF